MRRCSLLFLPLILFALACAPLQALDATLDLPDSRFQAPVAYARGTSGSPLHSNAAAFNGMPLQTQTTAHENVYLEQGVPNALRQTIIAGADITSRRLMSDLGWSGVPRANIYVFPSRKVWLQGISQIGGLSQKDVVFQTNLQGDAWITIGGTARPGIYLYPIQQSPAVTLHMLAHEYTHVIQQQMLNRTTDVPVWFLEGLAEAEGGRIAASQYPKDHARNEAEIQQFVASAAKEKRLFSLEGIAASSAWQLRLERPWSAMLEYAESRLAIEYVQRLKGTNAPMNILIMTANDGDFPNAFLKTMGMNLAAFEAKFFASLK
jgi:hypothetical protein